MADFRYDCGNINNAHEYLNSVDSKRSADRYAPNWSKARRASKSLNVSWDIEGDNVSILVSEDSISDRRAIFFGNRKHLRERRTASLREHRHQGKTNKCVAVAKANSHFFTTGSCNQFKEWRFIRKARLGLVKLNAYPWNSDRVAVPGQVDKRCRKCGRDETLPHVLNCCMRHSTLYRERHDA